MKYLSVKNWDKFQHYRDRNPVWIKLYLDLLDDYGFAQLSDAERGQLVMIWLLAARSDGVIPDDPKWIAQRIGASGRVSLRRLTEAGFLCVAEPEQLASKTGAEPEQNASLEGERETEGEKRRAEADSDAPRDWSTFWESVPETYRDAIRNCLRVAKSSNGMRQTLVAMTQPMGQPADQVFTPEVVAQAAHEVFLTGDVTPLRLRTFAARITRDRASGPQPGLYDDAA